MGEDNASDAPSRTVYFTAAGVLFEWDAQKAVLNAEKHGIEFRQAAEAFLDVLNLTRFDAEHSTHEDRYVTIGKTRGELVVCLIHTDRENRVRIISARKADAREKRIYEQRAQ